jgi:hypothetical protein|tara:strand:+ start:1752 stop:2630 length:879 start_codon:yes stop_codon:yes gene_type:complete
MRLHLAGIVPVANIKTDHENPVPEILVPVDNGFSAIQKSVYECAMAGCSTIWIVANDDLIPLVRKTIGEWIYDPVYYARKFSKFYKEQRKEVPIYYVPIHPKDRDRRDSYGWSIIHGIHSAWRTSYKISQWIVPQKYYISFPMGLFDVEQVREHRKYIKDKEKNFFFTHKNKTVKDDLPLSFTMTGEDFKLCRRHINKKTSREYLPPLPGQQYPTQKIPLSQRWSARRFPLSEIFQPLATEQERATKVEVDWFYDGSTWGQYIDYLASDNIIEKPYKELVRPHKHEKFSHEE